MKLISWNVNGIRAWMAKDGTLDYVTGHDPDFFCMQETKAQPDQFENPLPQYLHTFYNSAEKKGYSGVAIYTKHEPQAVYYEIPDLPLADSEGRFLCLEYADFYLVNVYTPNAKDDLSRLPLRYNDWDPKMLAHIKKLEQTKPVIYCGDMNVAHSEIDLKNDKSNMTTDKRPGTHGFTDQERERFGDYLTAGFVDTFRYLHPDTVQYSWWSYRATARANNSGWRIDYFLTSDSLADKITAAEIHDQQTGSDHCPVSLEIKLKP